MIDNIYNAYTQCIWHKLKLHESYASRIVSLMVGSLIPNLADRQNKPVGRGRSTLKEHDSSKMIKNILKTVHQSRFQVQAVGYAQLPNLHHF